MMPVNFAESFLEPNKVARRFPMNCCSRSSGTSGSSRGRRGDTSVNQQWALGVVLTSPSDENAGNLIAVRVSHCYRIAIPAAVLR
jgi:hypothetical protein